MTKASITLRERKSLVRLGYHRANCGNAPARNIQSMLPLLTPRDSEARLPTNRMELPEDDTAHTATSAVVSMLVGSGFPPNCLLDILSTVVDPWSATLERAQTVHWRRAPTMRRYFLNRCILLPVVLLSAAQSLFEVINGKYSSHITQLPVMLLLLPTDIGSMSPTPFCTAE